MARLSVDSPLSSPVTIRQPGTKRITKPPPASTSSVPIISVPETPVTSAQSSPRKLENTARIFELETRIEALTAENTELKNNLTDTGYELESAEYELSVERAKVEKLTCSNLQNCEQINDLTAEVTALKRAPATKIRVLKSPDRTPDDKDQRITELETELKSLQEKYEESQDTLINTEHIYGEEICSLREQLAAATAEQTPQEKTILMANKRRVELAAEAEEKKLKKAAAAEKKVKGKKKADPKPDESNELPKSWWDQHYREFPEETPDDWVFDSEKSG
ncbi:hypothetical protein CYMTET_5961 [Cymbomonas tetramitiformis]|uniref:Uncharacterized protein n=1 Tax=Cymbomonas tetramitiformis TaxID=36881 RepID=A0AAE0GYE2_9CHLO|nr:hypothetical protein CYMTET_5961 [Cymbomonas tetramitiformis]